MIEQKDRNNKRILFRIAKTTKLTEEQARDAINCLFDIINEEVRINGKIYVSGLGTFFKKEATRKCGITGDYNTFFLVKFTPTMRFKDIVNNRFHRVGSETLYDDGIAKIKARSIRKMKNTIKKKKKKNEYNIRRKVCLDDIPMKEHKKRLRVKLLSDYGLRKDEDEDDMIKK